MRLKILLFLYYAFLQHIPMQPMPGWKIGYLLRGWIVTKILRYYGVVNAEKKLLSKITVILEMAAD